MAKTFFFYDLETSGLNPREDRIMQFAGQRTDMELNPIGEPYDVLVALNDDTLPSPEAITVTGITPQQTIQDGYTEAQFSTLLLDEVFTPDTITVGFNSIRFDDEFIRALFWRNFRDPYEWAYRDGRSRWDLLDVVRLTRALRPDGINWPVKEDGTPTNRLELITALNGMTHEKAHDALSDVVALIQVAKLVRERQPELFNYLLKLRDKKAIMEIVDLDDPRPFVYASGRYENEYQKTTVAYPVGHGQNGAVLVWDLRYNPSPFISLSSDELAKRLFISRVEREAAGLEHVPVKPLQYNKAPAVAPLGVLGQHDGWQRVQLQPDTITLHRDILRKNPNFVRVIEEAFKKRPAFAEASDAEAKLYDGFIPSGDKVHVQAVAHASEGELTNFAPPFQDERLKELLVRYKARNFPRTLSQTERGEWESWRAARIATKLPDYLKSLSKLATSGADEYLLGELTLWAESIAPAYDEDQSGE
ncbi:exodeoxyribonuclease I [Candidatus Saccharibacteria bacterium]|nr:exodeoxyribonuclease I [Candidatus Saccharibacteria bacterium]